MDFLAVSFVVDIESRCNALFLSAYLNGTDSYAKLQLIIFEF